MPGPEVAVKARAPFQPAPITAPMAEISSSAWTMAYLFFLVSGSTRYFLQCLAKDSATEVEGVMGYQAATVGPPKTQPKAAASLPLTKMRLPTSSARSALRPHWPER